MQQVSAVSPEKRRVPLVKTDQGRLSLVNMMQELTMNDSAVETKKSSKTKEERHKGTSKQVLL